MTLTATSADDAPLNPALADTWLPHFPLEEFFWLCDFGSDEQGWPLHRWLQPALFTGLLYLTPRGEADWTSAYFRTCALAMDVAVFQQRVARSIDIDQDMNLVSIEQISVLLPRRFRWLQSRGHNVPFSPEERSFDEQIAREVIYGENILCFERAGRI